MTWALLRRLRRRGLRHRRPAVDRAGRQHPGRADPGRTREPNGGAEGLTGPAKVARRSARDASLFAAPDPRQPFHSSNLKGLFRWPPPETHSDGWIEPAAECRRQIPAQDGSEEDHHAQHLSQAQPEHGERGAGEDRDAERRAAAGARLPLRGGARRHGAPTPRT